MLQEILAIELLNDSLMPEQGTLCNVEESAEMKFVDSFMNPAENRHQDLMEELSVETEKHSNFKSSNCDRNYFLHWKGSHM